MKRLFLSPLSIILFLSSFLGLAAQTPTPPKIVLTWQDTVNPTATTYNVKEVQGLCTGTPTFNTIATGLTVKTFTKTNVSPGAYCYVVTAVFAGIESSPSNTSGVTVTPTPPVLAPATVAQLQFFYIPKGIRETLSRKGLTSL